MNQNTTKLSMNSSVVTAPDQYGKVMGLSPGVGWKTNKIFVYASSNEK